MSDEENRPSGDQPKYGFWEGLSKEPPREGDKWKAVIFGISLAIAMIALAWFTLHKNSAPIE
jgi:hypothetical protein